MSKDTKKRKQEQEEINFLATILQKVPDAVCSIDLEGNLTSWNDGAEKMLGYKAEEILGKHITKIIPEELGQKELEHCVNTLNQEGFLSGHESLRVAKDGSTVPIELTGVALKDKDQNITGYASIMRDVTDRKQAEQALRKSKENLETILNSVEDGIMVIGRDYKIVEANPAIERITKLPRGRIIGKYCYEISHRRDSPCEPPNDICPLKEVFKTGKPFTVTHKHFDRDGNVSYIELVTSPVRGEDGEITQVLEVSRDITERIMAEEARRESEKRYRELFENSRDGTYTLDKEGRFTSVNKTMEEITGYKREELLGKKKLDIVHEDSQEDVSNHFADIMKGREPLPIELQILHKKGYTLDVEARAAPITEGDKIIGVQESVRDITFRIALEKELEALNNELTHYSQQLEQSNQLKGLFTDILRHDLLNPTGVIRNLAEILIDDEKLKDSEELAIIKRNIIKLEGIITSASQYAKLESEEKLEMSELDLSELIKNIINDLDTYIREKRMNVEFKPDGEQKINASKAIESVFVNILSNAIKYSPENTDIKIAIEDAGDSKKISFADQGDGIADEHKEAVFDRFTRKDKMGVKGTGLGLAIVKRIVDMHDGRVWVEDNPEGKGSVFYVELPKSPI